MPLSLADIKGNVRTTNVVYFEDNFSVTYRPGAITPVSESEDRQRLEAGEEHVLADRLATIVVAWDIVADGETVPVTQEFMRQLPSPLLLAIRDAIMEDARPKPKSARGSFAR